MFLFRGCHAEGGKQKTVDGVDHASTPLLARRSLLKGIPSLAAFCGLSVTGSPHIVPNNKGVVSLSSSGIELVIDGRTGAWTRLIDKHSGASLLWAPSNCNFFSLKEGGSESAFPIRLRPPGDTGLLGARTFGTRFRLEAHTLIDEGTAQVLSVQCRQGPWRLTVSYRIPLGEKRVERRFRISYGGPREVFLREIEIFPPIILTSPGQIIEIPAASLPPSLRADSQLPQKLNAGDSRLYALRDPKSKRVLLFWTYSETEIAQPEMIPTIRPSPGLMPTYRVQLASRMKPGAELEWQGDFLWILDDGWPDSLKRFQGWWNEVGVQTPRNRPEWTEKALIYETQIGAALFDRGQHQFNPYPTIQSLIDKLDYIQSLGFNTVQLMPQHPCPSYAVFDYFEFEHQYGDDVGLATLVNELHKRNMRIILDWIVHGVIDKEIARKLSHLIRSVNHPSYRHTGLADYVLNFAPAWIADAPEANPLRLRHPDWFMKREDGRLAYIYTWAFDLQNEELQDYIIQAMESYIRKYDVDGFRVDAPTWNDFPNWDKNIRYRASLSETGGIRLIDRARPRLHQLKPELMLYTEPTGPTFRRMFDVNYSYDEVWMIEQLLSWRRRRPTGSGANFELFLPKAFADRVVTAYDFRVWLEDRRLSLPEGSMTIHQVDSHDSFWWLPWGFKFRHEQFGVEGYRALYFMLATLDGGLMQYPTGEKHSEHFVARTNALRQTVSELREGRCDYLKVEVSDRAVFAVSWEAPSGWAVPITNFGERATAIRVGLPGRAFNWRSDAKYLVYGEFNHKQVNGKPEAVLYGRDLTNLSVQLDPLESELLVFRKL
jgi:hypothetical protein